MRFNMQSNMDKVKINKISNGVYVLGINGSPRIGGNTDILLDRALQGARNKGAQTEKIILNKLKFSPCQECEKLRDDGTCIIEDDMQPVYKKIEQADAIILASPIFFGSVSAQTKMMIDRFQCAWRAKYILNKDVFSRKRKGAFICVEASDRKDFFANAKSIVKNFFATINADYSDELLCSGIDEKAKILKHPDVLERAFDLGSRIIKKE
jgi:multimeric flavodoxin WrbA